ncbi:MAG: hypothetical protein PHH06_00805 [Candidatus Gracilibacteria bacterium]|nr:hypothetical protein [Candidatus Gracilibacteria bacterium]
MASSIKDENIIKNKLLKSISKNIYFEYDDEIKEYCVFFNNIDGYYGQGKTKELAVLELLSGYLDTCNC